MRQNPVYFPAMNNLITLSIIFSITFLIFQRTERKRLWLIIVFLEIPLLAVTWYWASFKNQERVFILAVGIALVLNVLFWLVYGRRNPPGSSDDIKVIGTEE